MEAVVSAAVARFRPILMTSLSTILGILPIALALGAGAESRVSMGVAVIGGLIFSGGLTLFVIPAVYSYFSKGRRIAAVPERVMTEPVVVGEPEEAELVANSRSSLR
jgi:multidrug efflux pump